MSEDITKLGKRARKAVLFAAFCGDDNYDEALQRLRDMSLQEATIALLRSPNCGRATTREVLQYLYPENYERVRYLRLLKASGTPAPRAELSEALRLAPYA